MGGHTHIRLRHGVRAAHLFIAAHIGGNKTVIQLS